MEIVCPTCNTSHHIPSDKVHQGTRALVMCDKCGGQIVLEPPSTPLERGEFEFITEDNGFKVYGGFWKRCDAAIIDGFILIVVGFVIGGLIGFAYGFSPGISEGASARGSLVGIILGWLYFAIMESSSKQGTLGKMALGIKVTDLSGDPISFGRATIRHFSKIISTILLLVGHLMVAFTARKQGLHDMIAGCLVLNKG
ncbi:MAG: zinc-ribbon domain-containing protein [Desulfobacterales bacterium]|nr:zinc-ribbon domain-containing protein [Desulfobacterales bacterium]